MIMAFYKDIEFSLPELARYDRHLILPEFGLPGQQKLKSARVLVVGAGGLGNAVLPYLAAAGVGTIGILDAEKLEDSNLQRHILCTYKDLGRSKARSVKARLGALNPHIAVHYYDRRLTLKNAPTLFSQYEIIVDCTDNYAAHYLISDICVQLDKTCIYASVAHFGGELTVFNHVDENGVYGPNYRDLYPIAPALNHTPNGTEGGLLGVVSGILGTMQALETIKAITHVGELLHGRLCVFDARQFNLQIRPLLCRRQPESGGASPGRQREVPQKLVRFEADQLDREISLYNLKGELLAYIEGE